MVKSTNGNLFTIMSVTIYSVNACSEVIYHKFLSGEDVLTP